MKSITRTFLPEIFSNSISRNLIMILMATMFAAMFLVTAAIMVIDQW